MTSLFSRLLPAFLLAPAMCAAQAGDATTSTAAPSLTASATVTLASQYVSRGMRQTWGRPALQAGVDVVHASGWSAGTWMSTVSDRFIEGGRVEWDLYGGYAGTLGPLGYSLTAVHYRYPGARISSTGTTFDYTELAPGLSYKSLYAKYYRTVSRDFFGIVNARGTGYLDIGANHDLGGGWTLNLHLGDGRVAGAGNEVWDWRDAKAGVTRTFDAGWSVAAAYTRAWGATDAYDRYTTGVARANGAIAYSNPAEGTFTVNLTRTF
ncbi:TorF family putative porin [Massilia agri]|uniref:TorF family putative porin n=1 Tax=Massilia agri TaxID=1886785 RepID=A0ABT2AJ44_9BURK|nr:TorF family putative porin [Massilia agri]MCS0596040.1 TorF family putative porin [Massilia agri]